MLYSTDASIYQVEPIGVVIPHSISDAAKVLAYLAAEGVAVLPRGSGTALAGQSVNEAVVVDFSQYCRAVLSVDVTRQRAIVEAGVTLDQLNEAVGAHGLMFGPDVATSSHATIGGMIGNNSAGAHSILYGRTVENLLALDVVLPTPPSIGLRKEVVIAIRPNARSLRNSAKSFVRSPPKSARAFPRFSAMSTDIRSTSCSINSSDRRREHLIA